MIPGIVAAAYQQAGGSPPVETYNDPHWDKVKLLITGNGVYNGNNIVDESPIGRAITPAGNLKYSRNQVRYGYTSLLFDGASDYATISKNSDLYIQNDYTIEFSVYFTAFTASNLEVILSARSVSIPEWQINTNSSQNIGVAAWDIGSTIVITGNSSPTVLSINTWYDVAYDFDFVNSETRLYIAGNLIVTIPITGTPHGTANPLYLGRDPTVTSRDLNAYLANIRLTKGVCRHTGASYTLEGKQFKTNTGWDPSFLFANGEFGAWYDPSDMKTMFQDHLLASPVTTAGQTVGGLLNKVSNTLSLSNDNAAFRPIYNTAGGLHYLDFDGVNDFLRSQTFTTPLLGGGGAGCLAIVFSPDNADAVQGAAEEVLGTGTTNARIVAYADTRASPKRVGVYCPDGTDDEAKYVDLDAENNSPRSIILNIGATIVEGYVNGVLQADTASSALSFAAGNRTISLGRQSVGPIYFDGKLYQAVFINRSLTSEEITLLDTFLKTKAGLI